MKTTYILLLFAMVQSSCNNTNPSEDNSRSKIGKAEVLDAVEAFRLSLLDPTEASLLAQTDSSLTYGHSSALIEDRHTFIASLTSGKFKFTALQFSDVSIELAGCAAVVRHRLVGRSADQGKAPGPVNLHVVMVWYKDPQGLRLLTRQAVKL